MALWKIKAKIIPRSTDSANWSCHWAPQMVLSQQKAMWQEVPSNLRTQVSNYESVCCPICSPGSSQTASDRRNYICSVSAQLTWGLVDWPEEMQLFRGRLFRRGNLMSCFENLYLEVNVSPILWKTLCQPPEWGKQDSFTVSAAHPLVGCSDSAPFVM